MLELDRVMDSQPDALDAHRVGLMAARRQRARTIAQTTQALLIRLDAAVQMANTKVLFHPSKSPEVVECGSKLSLAVAQFNNRIGIESERRSVDAKQWRSAASELKSRARAAGADGMGVASQFGYGSLDRAKSVRGKVAEGLPRRLSRRRGPEDPE